MAFHEIRFPTAISRGAQVGPERRTDIVTLGSGFEERNSRWADSRRSYNAGYGVKTLDALYDVISFFEERRGRLFGFRWKDPLDFKSTSPSNQISAQDQVLGTGDGIRADFQLRKVYGSVFSPWLRDVKKPVAGTVSVSVDGILQSEGGDYNVDDISGVVSFLAGKLPGPGGEVAAGFEFDVPVRFDSDRLEINLSNFDSGAIPDIPLVEIRI